MMTKHHMRKILFGALGAILMSGLVSSCNKKNDPTAANAGGGTTNSVAVLTVNGAPR
jgi:hypothetical protein